MVMIPEEQPSLLLESSASGHWMLRTHDSIDASTHHHRSPWDTWCIEDVVQSHHDDDSMHEVITTSASSKQDDFIRQSSAETTAMLLELSLSDDELDGPIVHPRGGGRGATTHIFYADDVDAMNAMSGSDDDTASLTDSNSSDEEEPDNCYYCGDAPDKGVTTTNMAFAYPPLTGTHRRRRNMINPPQPAGKDWFANTIITDDHAEHDSEDDALDVLTLSSSSNVESGSTAILRQQRMSSAGPLAHIKQVHFGNVQVREYTLTVGDHPSARDSCPITLDWSHTTTVTRQLEHYERLRAHEQRWSQRLGLRRLTLEERRYRLATVQHLSAYQVFELEQRMANLIDNDDDDSDDDDTYDDSNDYDVNDDNDQMNCYHLYNDDDDDDDDTAAHTHIDEEHYVQLSLDQFLTCPVELQQPSPELLPVVIQPTIHDHVSVCEMELLF